MLEPPANLSTDMLRACLHAQYGLAVAEITFLPIGHDPGAWVYRVQATDGASYFLKVRLRLANEASVLVPHHLQDQGITRVTAPIPTRDGALWTRVGTYAVILYPFVEHRTGMARGMSDAQWIAYGTIVRQIHGAALPPDLERRLRRESFRPDGANEIRRLDAHLAAGALADAESQALAAFWHDHRDLIHTVLERAEDLGQRLARKSPGLVLCHADIHTNNVLLDADEQVWITDWDETMLAPCERDLMFMTDGGIHRWVVGPREEALALQGYGEADIDPLGLAYYRAAWATSDIGSYGESVCFRPDLGPATRRESVDRFKSLFVPGSIVPLALASEAYRSGATR